MKPHRTAVIRDYTYGLQLFHHRDDKWQNQSDEKCIKSFEPSVESLISGLQQCRFCWRNWHTAIFSEGRAVDVFKLYLKDALSGPTKAMRYTRTHSYTGVKRRGIFSPRSWPNRRGVVVGFSHGKRARAHASVDHRPATSASRESSSPSRGRTCGVARRHPAACPPLPPPSCVSVDQ